MKLAVKEFREWPNKCITLLGMSGVGKTRLANILRQHHWFHYSGDYRIGTRYLDEPILDNIKRQAMQVPFLRQLLLLDSIYISNNITVDNLAPLSTFLGKLGNPECGGLPLKEFKRRQKLHLDAEIRAMKDVPGFIDKAQRIYGYKHFVNDAGGSLCELDSQEVLDTLSTNTLILYIRATAADERDLLERAQESPKPLFYREGFLDENLAVYMRENDLDYASLVDPDDFTRWVLPRLFRARVPRYEEIAEKLGYTITTDELQQIENVDDFLKVVETAIERTT